MKRRFLVVCAAVMMICSSAAVADDYDISGGWNIRGTGFVEKGVVRVSLTLNGDMNLTTATTAEILNNSVSRDLVDSDLLSGDLKFLTGYEGNLRVDATGLSISVWEDALPNGIRVPVALPEVSPTVNEPCTLPVRVTSNGLNYRVTLTSTESGKLRINGITDFGELKDAELNADCTVWKHGTPMPALDEETSSGCNSGFSALMLLFVFAGVKKIVRN